MMRTTLLLFASVAIVSAAAFAQAPGASKGPVTSLYDLKTTTLLGKPADLGDFRGKVTLVVNVAARAIVARRKDFSGAN